MASEDLEYSAQVVQVCFFSITFIDFVQSQQHILRERYEKKKFSFHWE